METNGWHVSSNVKYHLKNGSMHNLEGPAVIHPDNHCEFWIDGTYFPKKEWFIEVRKYYETEEDFTLMVLMMD